MQVGDKVVIVHDYTWDNYPAPWNQGMVRLIPSGTEATIVDYMGDLGRARVNVKYNGKYNPHNNWFVNIDELEEF